MHGTYFNATIAVYVTLNLRLGKDEVGSSNLPSSSKKALKTSVFDAFCCKNAEIKCSPSQGHFHLTHSGSIPAGYSPVVM